MHAGKERSMLCKIVAIKVSTESSDDLWLSLNEMHNALPHSGPVFSISYIFDLISQICTGFALLQPDCDYTFALLTLELA